MKINTKYQCSYFLADIQRLLHPAQVNFGYFPAWFQPLQLPSTQSESPLALIPLAPKSHASFKVRTQP
jgi:hypothetical protein